jgi:ANTAR domain/GAF domain
VTASNDVRSDIEFARRRADDALRRAEHAASNARRYELLAAGDPESLRAFHYEMAAKCRQIEEMQRTSAILQTAYAMRLERWHAGSPGRNEPLLRPRFMATVAQSSGCDSASLTLGVPGHLDAVTVASDATASAAQNLESELREGPGRDAIRTRELVSAVGQAIAGTWPSYGPDLAELGIRAVMAIPLEAAGECLGALTVFGEPPACTADGVARLRTVADALTSSVLLAPDSTAVGDDEVPHFPALEENEEWPVVHQAAGMLAARNDCSIADAFSLIRAHAFAESTSIPAVAELIVRRELVLPED